MSYSHPDSMRGHVAIVTGAAQGVGKGVATALLERGAARLQTLWDATHRTDWHWFEASLAYDNARLPEALIRAGYGRTPREIGRYTLRQIRMFFDQEQARERRESRRRVADNNAAFAGGDAAKRHMKDLED